MSRKRKPVTILTGYLGSGKTTVMNELLKNQEGKRLALIVNDMGSINIDASLLKKNSVTQMDAKMIELQNGCICCTLREEFMTQIEELSADLQIDAVLVEASGISNPASIAEGFLDYAENQRNSNIYLNTIVTVVDADRMHKEFLDDLEKEQEIGNDDDPDIINLVMDQIEFCNMIILNKCDLLNRESIERVKHVIAQIQPEAEIVESVRGKIDFNRIINGQRFDYEKVMNSSTLQRALAREEKSSKSRDEYGISSFVYEERRPFQEELFMRFIEDYPEHLIRAKGYIWFQDDDMHVQLFEQAGRNASVTEVSNWVASFDEKEKQEVIDNYPEVLDDWDEVYGDRLNQIVFIGKDYDQEEICKKLNQCLAVE